MILLPPFISRCCDEQHATAQRVRRLSHSTCTTVLGDGDGGKEDASKCSDDYEYVLISLAFVPPRSALRVCVSRPLRSYSPALPSLDRHWIV